MKKVLLRVSGSIGETFTSGDSMNTIILLYTDAPQELEEVPIEFLSKPQGLFETEPHVLFDSDYPEKNPGGKLYILKSRASRKDYDDLKRVYEEEEAI